MKTAFLLAYFVLSTQNSFAIEGTGLEVSVGGDIIYSHGLNDDSQADDKMTMRGAEFMFYAPVDHKFDAVLSAAAHDEAGQNIFELHELFVSSSKLIPRSRIKAGQFFLGVGRLNRFHQHDWPFIRAPKVHETFFDTEGALDTGVEYSILLPTERVFDLTIGVTSGYKYGHSHTEGAKPKMPTHYARLATFFPWSSTNGLETGLNYLSRTDNLKNRMTLYGLDATGKIRSGKRLAYLFQSEAWYRNNEDAAGLQTNQTGLYIYNQYGYSTQTSFGFRIDGFKDLDKRNAITNEKLNNINYNFVQNMTYKTSEFTTFRLALSHGFTREEGITLDRDTRLEAQMIFILGSHPAHQF